MTDDLIARKGAATPAAIHPGDAARFHARRTVVLPAINLHMTAMQTEPAIDTGRERPKRAARLIASPVTEKRRFTFRIDPARHAAFCRAAETRNVSRQRLLTEALDAFLARLGHAPGAVGPGPDVPRNATHEPGARAVLRPDHATAPQPPL